MTILRIDASIQGSASAGSQLADLVVAEVTANHPELDLVSRHLGEQPLPSTAWAAAIVGGATPESERTADSATHSNSPPDWPRSSERPMSQCWHSRSTTSGSPNT